MIIIVEGKLGSGKTYWSVNYLVEKHYVYKEDLFQYVPKGNVKVVTNIKELSLPHVDLDDEVKRLGGLDKVFSWDYEGVQDRGVNLLFIVDEAQGPAYFHRKYFNPSVFLFFQKSRHVGVDIILITQDKYTLSKEVQVLSEYNVQAIQRTVRTKNVFMYKYMIGDEVAKRKQMIFSKRIAGLYKSFDKLESEKVTYVWKKYAIGIVVCFVFVVLAFKVAVGSFFGASDKKGVRAVSGALAPPSASKTAREEVAKAPGSFAEYEQLGQKVAYKKADTGVTIPGRDLAKEKANGPMGPSGSPGEVPPGGPSAGIRVGGIEKDEDVPLVPMKCMKPEKDGWQECFEGVRYVGRFKAWRVESTLPEYGRRE